MNKQEHTYIQEYLKGELDWELLVSEVGEDMARGVRIAENFYSEDKVDEPTLEEIEKVVTSQPVRDLIFAMISDNIKKNGEIAQTMQSSFGLYRKGKRT